MSNFILNRKIKILLATNGFILLAGAMIGPIYALFVEDIGGSLLDASFAGSLFALAAGITTLVFGKLSDTVKENELIIALGYFLMGVGFFLYSIIETITGLFLVQLLIGFSEAIYAPSFDSIYSVNLDKNKEGSEWGVWESMNYFVTARGALLGGFIVFKWNFDVLFVIMSVLSISSALYIYLLPRDVL